MKPLKIGDVMKITGLSQTTVLRMTKTGKLRCWYTPGGHTRYRPDDIVEFIQLYGAPLDLEVVKHALSIQ